MLATASSSGSKGRPRCILTSKHALSITIQNYFLELFAESTDICHSPLERRVRCCMFRPHFVDDDTAEVTRCDVSVAGFLVQFKRKGRIPAPENKNASVAPSRLASRELFVQEVTHVLETAQPLVTLLILERSSQ